MMPAQAPTTPLTVHLMTAALTPGDAIGNYILTTARLLRGWGVRVYLYADHIDPAFGALAGRSQFYRPTGADILWFHYSIYADNFAIARHSPDFKLMDYHGISPPHLLAGQNTYVAALCRRAQAELPDFAGVFDAQIVHSAVMRQELIGQGFSAETIHTFPLCLDTEHFAAGPDATLNAWLSRLDYLLFVGRVVPQKDVTALVRLFAALHVRRPDLRLIIVGSRHLAPAYQTELDRQVRRARLADAVLFTGPITHPDVLAALYRQAAFYVALSEWESFCVPVAEAAYFGTPSVVQALPPLPEVAGPGGVVIDKRRIEDSAETILYYLNHPAAHQALRQAAQTWAQRYTSDALAANLIRLFRDIWNV